MAVPTRTASGRESFEARIKATSNLSQEEEAVLRLQWGLDCDESLIPNDTTKKRELYESGSDKVALANI